MMFVYVGRNCEASNFEFSGETISDKCGTNQIAVSVRANFGQIRPELRHTRSIQIATTDSFPN